MTTQQIVNVQQKYKELNVINPYTIGGNAELLKKLLPPGPLWRIVLPPEQQIKMKGIPSEEAFGDFLVVKPGGVFVATTPVDFGIQKALDVSDPAYEHYSTLSNDSGVPPIPTDLYSVEITGVDASVFDYYFPFPTVPSPGAIPCVFTFAPRAQTPNNQTYTAQASIISNATNPPHIVDLIGRASKFDITMAPEPIDFGAIVDPAPLQVQEVIVTITNPTAYNADLLSAIITGVDASQFTWDTPFGSAIPAGGSLQFKVFFTVPSSVVMQPYSASIEVKVVSTPFTEQPLENSLLGTITANVVLT